MTEQEKRRRRREAERQMRRRYGERKKGKNKTGWMAFRVYVTVILVGGCFLISMFHSESSEKVCAKVKEVIAVQVSEEAVTEWKDKAAEYLKEKEDILSVFQENGQQTEKTYHPDTEP